MQTTDLEQHKPELGTVPLNLLVVDPAVQRGLIPGKAEKIAADLNLDAIGLLCASRRANGSYHLIDGQHRAEALRLAGFGDAPIDCEIFHGLTLAEEAAMFRRRNNRSPVQRVDLFKVKVAEGDPDAVALSDMLTRHGWKVTISNNEGCLAAIEAVENLYALDKTGQGGYPPAVERALVTVTASWGHAATSVERHIIGGIGAVYLRYGSEVDSADVIDRLARFPGGARALSGKARGLRDLIGGKVSASVAEIVVEEYNRRRKTRALRPWRAD